MNKEIKAKWVAALRSGQYKQTGGHLRVKDRFCCLGVLCNLHAQAHPDVAAKQKEAGFYLGNEMELPTTVQKWAGLECSRGAEVSINGCKQWLDLHNDDGRTFRQIASAISEQM